MKKKYDKFEVKNEIIRHGLYLLILLFPLYVTLIVSSTGRLFSNVGEKWQRMNVDGVATCIFIFIIAYLTVLLIMNKLKVNYLVKYTPRVRSCRLTNPARLFFIILMIVSGFGLFKSFGGTIFNSAYTGPKYAWLGYGAWNVTYLIALGVLTTDYLTGTVVKLRFLIVVTVMFLPFLLSGSRIDYLSYMIALSAYVITMENDKYRYLKASGIILWAILIILPLGKLRYELYDHQKEINFKPTTQINLNDDKLYLSTIGDIGASVFQVVGVVESGVEQTVGIGKAFEAYAVRLLPGSFVPNRPGDFHINMKEKIHGGALHSVGEGYIIKGMWGVFLIGAQFSIFAWLGNAAIRNKAEIGDFLANALYMLPWFLIIRSGWYQFFSIYKAYEILGFLSFVLLIINKLKREANYIAN